MNAAVVTPVQRLGAAWDRFVTDAAAEGYAVDTTAILAPLGRRLTRVDPPRRVQYLTPGVNQ